jgi:hypothetical protein
MSDFDKAMYEKFKEASEYLLKDSNKFKKFIAKLLMKRNYKKFKNEHKEEFELIKKVIKKEGNKNDRKR